MPRILAIDYGAKRTGIAATDPLQIIASAVGTVETPKLTDWFKNYLKTEQVEKLVVGQPFRMDGSTSDIEQEILKWIEGFQKDFPHIKLIRINEAFTSKQAMQTLIASGVKKKERRNKELLDAVSATIILQEYLEQIDR